MQEEDRQSTKSKEKEISGQDLKMRLYNILRTVRYVSKIGEDCE
jgi:hypothetical protein